MTIRIDTHEYEWCHGRKPRTQHGQASAWAFQLDGTTAVLCIYGWRDLAARAAPDMSRQPIRADTPPRAGPAAPSGRD